MKMIQPVVIGIIRHHGKYLLTKRIHKLKEHHDKWQFPGGGMEFGENLEDCLAREIKEEVNLSLKSMKLIPILFTEIRETWQGVLIPYLSEAENIKDLKLLDEESSDYGWFTPQQIKKLPALAYTYEIVEETEKLK